MKLEALTMRCGKERGGWTYRLGLLALRKACVGKLALPQLAFSVGDHLSWNVDVYRALQVVRWWIVKLCLLEFDPTLAVLGSGWMRLGETQKTRLQCTE